MLALTTTEAAAFTGLDERVVRKDVEQGVLEPGSPPRFAEVALVYFRACASFAFHLDVQDRKRLYAVIADAQKRQLARLDLGSGWSLDVSTLSADLHARIARFEEWRRALVTRDEILGGEPVFPGTRLAVRHVGEMLVRGADPDEVREDHSSLTEQDLEFARLFVAAYPRVEKPRDQAAAR